MTSMPLPTLAVLRKQTATPWVSSVPSLSSSEQCGICCSSSYAAAQPVYGSLRPCFPQRGVRNGGRSGQVVRMAPEEEKMTRRSPLDFPIEWERPKPGRRPDIFPQFSPMKTPLPPPLPVDPPEEDEEEEEEEKKEEEEDPEKEEPAKQPEKQFTLWISSLPRMDKRGMWRFFRATTVNYSSFCKRLLPGNKKPRLRQKCGQQ